MKPILVAFFNPILILLVFLMLLIAPENVKANEILFHFENNLLARGDKSEATEIKVILDANLVSFSAPPVITNSTTLVQFRPIFERLGLQIRWDEQNQTIIGQKEETKIQLQIGNPDAIVNGKAIVLPVAPTIVDGNTFVPIRFISESVDAKVDWDEKSRTVIIESKRQFASKDGKFHFTVYGLWENIADITKSVDTGQMDVSGAQLAIRYFKYTLLLMYSDSKADNSIKNLKLSEYLEHVKKGRNIAKKEIIEEKQTKILGFDALQIKYVNRNDWDKRIDTLLVFESDSHFYTILNPPTRILMKALANNFKRFLIV
ncbi:copper amine oxidase N-terminal domain-containing protein [Paenibacillus tyrfis]|uniref:copper amine oxidase N-terminal domain-containing protein n=1 Tax=Paenibacillus tyrfis TaxID=1501230 RepID=UPI00068F1274|nr:copper amine oxidase N-terminal domain-containing protein [Paenibacillus tyrfis]